MLVIHTFAPMPSARMRQMTTFGGGYVRKRPGASAAFSSARDVMPSFGKVR